MMEVGSNMLGGSIEEDLMYERGELADCCDKLKCQVKHNIYKLREMRDSLDRTVPENLIKVDCLNDEIRRLKQLEFLYGENALGKRVTR